MEHVGAVYQEGRKTYIVMWAAKKCNRRRNRSTDYQVETMTPQPPATPNNFPTVNRREDGELTLVYDYGSLIEHDAAIRNATLDAVITHCKERSKEYPDDETYVDSEMDLLEEWIEESLRQQAGERK